MSGDIRPFSPRRIPFKTFQLIRALINEGESLRRIQRKSGAHINTVLSIQNNYDDCPECGGTAKRSGRFSNTNRQVQIFQCLECGKSFSERQPYQNVRIPQHDIVSICKLSEDGHSIRTIGKMTGRDFKTIRGIISPRRHVWSSRKKTPVRDRREYFERYKPRQRQVNSWSRMIWRELVRAKIELILASSHRPMKVEEILTCLIVDFPEVTRNILGAMLAFNCMETFVKSGDFWSYQPSEIFIFHDGWPRDMIRAREIWFDKKGLKDSAREVYENHTKSQRERKASDERMRVVESVRGPLTIAAAAAAIGRILSKPL